MVYIFALFILGISNIWLFTLFSFPWVWLAIEIPLFIWYLANRGSKPFSAILYFYIIQSFSSLILLLCTMRGVVRLGLVIKLRSFYLTRGLLKELGGSLISFISCHKLIPLVRLLRQAPSEKFFVALRVWVILITSLIVLFLKSGNRSYYLMGLLVLCFLGRLFIFTVCLHFILEVLFTIDWRVSSVLAKSKTELLEVVRGCQTQEESAAESVLALTQPTWSLIDTWAREATKFPDETPSESVWATIKSSCCSWCGREAVKDIPQFEDRPITDLNNNSPDLEEGVEDTPPTEL